MIETIYSFVIAMLVVYRVARMMALEDGPAEVFKRWRRFLKQKFGRELTTTLETPGGPLPQTYYQPNWVAEGFGCPLCISFWAGWLVAWYVPGAASSPAQYCFTALALSGGAVFLVKMGG
jgi:hypothetical protein